MDQGKHPEKDGITLKKKTEYSIQKTEGVWEWSGQNILSTLILPHLHDNPHTPGLPITAMFIIEHCLYHFRSLISNYLLLYLSVQ